MYTKKELKAAANIIKKVALQNNVPEAQVRAEMQEAMDLAQNNPDPAAKALWANFHYAGPKPTLEEFILWTTKML